MPDFRSCLVGLILCASACSAGAGEAAVAVAANFVPTAQRIVSAFQARHAHAITLISGSTGKLAAQIVHGAPYDVLLAADQRTPIWLEGSGHAVAQTRFTYAIGSLSLCATDPAAIRSSLAETLSGATAIALANPELAPYGLAAQQVLDNIAKSHRFRVITGQSVAQVYGFVASGNVPLGFIAKAQQSSGTGHDLTCIDVPEKLHDPILQDAALLTRAGTNSAAKQFLAFLKTQPARSIVAEAGYKAVP